MVKVKHSLPLLFAFSILTSVAQPSNNDLDLSVQTRGLLPKIQLQTELQALSPQVRSLDCAGQVNMGDQELTLIAGQGVPHLNRLTLNGTGVTDIGVQALLNSTTVGVAGTIMGQPVLTLNISAADTKVDRGAFFRKGVPMTLYKAVSPGTQHIPAGGFVGEQGLSYQKIQGEKQAKITK